MEEEIVTIDVVPQAVAEVIYLDAEGLLGQTGEENSSSVNEEHENGTYEIGCVDASQAGFIYDESESFFVLSEDCQIEYENNEVKEEESHCEIKKTTTNKRKFKCSVCNGFFPSNKDLYHHRVLHKSCTKEKDPLKIYNWNECKVCGQKFSRTQALSLHFKRCHQLESNPLNKAKTEESKTISRYETPKFTCGICGCPCVNETALMFHYRKHEPQTFNCGICDAGYNNETDFSNHKKTHSEQFLYACNKCDESFPTTARVSHHIREVHYQQKMNVVSNAAKK